MAKKALILRFSSLGDVVLTSVLFEPLIERGFSPHLLTFKPYDELFVDDERVEVIGVTKEEATSPGLVERLKREGFELFVDVHVNLRTLYLKWKLGGRWVRYRKESLRRRLATKFKFFRKRYYVTESYLKAIGVSKRPALPDIKVSQERLERVKELLPSTDFVALAPGARYRKKMYPHFRKVARLLRREGIEVVWVGSEEEAPLAGEGLNLCGKVSLSDLLAVLKLSKVFVGNDSGLLHCARAVGTRAVQIYGGTHPTLGFSLYPQEGAVIIRDLDCQPCDVHGKGECKFGDYRCLEINPSQIVEQTMRLLREREK